MAQSSLQHDPLAIIRVYDQQTIAQTSWDSNWQTCAILWQNDITLGVQHQGTQEFSDFYISGNSLVSFNFQANTPTPYPTLPGRLPGTRVDFVLPSPNSNIVLYKRCSTPETRGSGQRQSCSAIPQYIIYNTAQQTDIHILQDPNTILIEGTDGNAPLGYGSAAWSAGGRYLAFEKEVGPNNLFDLSVYDLTSDQYLDTTFYNAQIDSYKAMQWSPQGNKLAFWVIGRMAPEPQAGDNPATLRTLIIFDADTSQYTIAANPYNFTYKIEQLGMWSPTGQSFVFVDNGKLLIDVDASKGTTTTLDTKVDSVINWKAETPSSFISATG